MENNELLKAILETVTGLKEDVKGLKDDVTGLKDDVKGLKDDVTGLKIDVKDIKTRVTKIETTLETETNKNIKLLVEGYSYLVDKTDATSENVEDIKASLAILDMVSKMNVKEINKLKAVK